MAKRRHKALASGIELMLELQLQQQKENRARQQRAQELYQKFEDEIEIEQMRHQGRLQLQRERLGQARYNEAGDPLTPDFSKPTSALKYLSPDEESQAFGGRTGGALSGQPFAGDVPLSPEGLNTMNRAIGTGVTQSPAARTSSRKIVRTGTDTATGRKVGQLDTGMTVYLDSGEPVLQ